MTDMTPVTDDDRIAHEWCDSPVRQSTEALAPIIRAIRAHVPAPPATLAEQILDIAGHISSDFGAYADDLTALADRVEAVEKENKGLAYDCKVLKSKYKTARKERDAAREKLADKLDEVAQLNTEVERQTAKSEALDSLVDSLNADLAEARGPQPPQVHPATASAPALPDPADVPVNTFWLIEFEGKHYEARRIPWSLREHHWSFMRDGAPCSAKDSEVTLVSRLVPDVRRVIDRPEDLDKLPVGSVILDKDGDPWTKRPSSNWLYGTLVAGSAYLLDQHGPVTVIHEPMVDSAPRS